MPNWIINKLSFEGSSVDGLDLLQSIASEEESIDFNKIVPRPADLEDWYSWCIEMWGTKWNAKDSYTTSSGEVVFETAWSTPFQVIFELSRQYPQVTLIVKFADESIGYNCGEYHLKNGEVVYQIEYNEVEACELWGYDPYELFDYMKREKNINDILEDDNDNSGV